MENLNFDGVAYNAFSAAGFMLFIVALALMVARTVVREFRDFRDWVHEDRRTRVVARRKSRR